MTTPPAAPSGTFDLGGDLPVTRLGYGTMQLHRRRRLGPAADRDEADRRAPPRRRARRHLLRHRRLLRPRRRRGPPRARPCTRTPTTSSSRRRPASPARARASWTPVGRPDYLRQQAELSLRRLGARADRPLPAAPHRPRGARRRPGRRAQGAAGRGQDPPHRAVRGLRRRAQGGAADRRDRVGAEPLQPHRPRLRGRCSTTATAEGIAFIPWFPLATGEARPARTARWPRRRGSTTRRRRSSRSRGCCSARRSCCRSRAPRASSTSRTTSPRPSIRLTDEEFAALEEAAA